MDILWPAALPLRAPLRMWPYTGVNRDLCHLPIELDHQAWWEVRTLSVDLNTTRDKRKLSFD